ncbi:homing endonuclease associated repeat-containing protein [Paenibacillus sp. LK1]|uniref:homing endonuclease associated repeat-containing protein n=1 Tax=Paenibacillus sp. LK1 TaxID=2053014 RepID=UPI000C19616C|nr:hypothetical protein [Paenibacillus sp. LK1]PIH59177.1 hypothetical protein CS562_14680 [Paenibacillus sp. LK1]
MIYIHKDIELSIIEDYKSGIKPKDICEKYNIKNFYKILDKYNVPRFNKKWTQNEINILESLYPTEPWETLLFEINRFPKEEIIRMASKLKIKRENYHYSSEELEYIRKYYSSMPTKEFVKKFFPSRTESAIHTKASKMGIVSRERWSEEENELLKDKYHNTPNRILKSKHFQNRSLTAIICQAVNLGLKKSITNVQFSNDELITSLKTLAEKLGHTPTADEILADEDIPSPMTFFRYFGSYNNACSEANLTPNPINTFGNCGFHSASDGTVCLSYAELTITEFFIENNISFEKEVPYADFVDDDRCGRKRSDWVLEDGSIIEYFGMPERESYKEKMNQKIDICKDNDIKLIALYRKDLNKLHKIFKPLTNVSTVTTKR